MKMHRFLTGTQRALSAIPVMGVLLLGSTEAQAQIAAVNPPQSVVVALASGAVGRSTLTTAVTSLAVAAPSAGTAETVSFSNANIRIDSTLARDPTLLTPPQVILNFTFLKALGVGLTSKASYIADYRVTKLRPLVGTDVIEIIFPFYPNTATGSREARSGRASFTLTFDTNGVITGATGTIGSSTF
jgi:hypothetical protein